MPAPVRIEVQDGNAVTITVPTIRRADLIDIITSFLAGDQEVPKERLQKTFAEHVGDVTIVLTTKL